MLDLASAPHAAEPGKDPMMLRKLSQSLRVQLNQPLGKTAVPDVMAEMPGSIPDGKIAIVQGTKAGPYAGFASNDWLVNEVKRDVEDLKHVVDVVVTRREHKTFEMERSALQAEIANLRKRLEASDKRAGHLETLLPKDNANFDHLRKAIESLDKECDQYCELLDKEEAARKGTTKAIKQALADMDHIEEEFGRIQEIINSLPEPTAQPMAPVAMPQQQQQQQAQQAAAKKGWFGKAAPAPVAAAEEEEAVSCSCFGGRRKPTAAQLQQAEAQRQQAQAQRMAILSTAGQWKGLPAPTDTASTAAYGTAPRPMLTQQSGSKHRALEADAAAAVADVYGSAPGAVQSKPMLAGMEPSKRGLLVPMGGSRKGQLDADANAAMAAVFGSNNKAYSSAYGTSGSGAPTPIYGAAPGGGKSAMLVQQGGSRKGQLDADAMAAVTAVYGSAPGGGMGSKKSLFVQQGGSRKGMLDADALAAVQAVQAGGY